ncbi:MAG: 4-hydroxythreonine-4-phosphate dehydrogenase PdxA [Rhizobiaceae bacterium]
MQSPRPLALTCGDAGGAGLDIAISAWLARRGESVPPFYLLAQPGAVADRARLLGADLSIRQTSPGEALSVFAEDLPIVTLENPQNANPGSALALNTAATIESIDRAVSDVIHGLAGAVVTLPIAKKPLQDAGFAFPGHTEYLAHLAKRTIGIDVVPVMMLAGPNLRAIPVTVHVPLADVPSMLSAGKIVQVCKIAANELRTRFGIPEPRIAIAGLNPHAGEDGAFGEEDSSIIRPAVEALAAEGFSVTGPLPADTMFHPAAREKYDAAVCMYHDQALIPAKALDFERTVNVTLGLPFVRTSPDHGTAFDIAGTGKANPTSLIEALKLADKLVRRSEDARA